MMNREKKAVLAVMRALNRINCVYDNAVKNFELGETELWILYALLEDEQLSQKKIHDEWKIPTTTINAIVKKWEESGYVELVPIPGKRREMTISLTASGKRRSHFILQKLFRMEENAMAAALDRYSHVFIEGLLFFEEKLKEEYENQFAPKPGSGTVRSEHGHKGKKRGER